MRDYKVALTPEQVQMLKTIFPRGVCDYTTPGQNQVPIAGTYLELPLPTRTPSTTTARSEQ